MNGEYFILFLCEQISVKRDKNSIRSNPFMTEEGESMERTTRRLKGVLFVHIVPERKGNPDVPYKVSTLLTPEQFRKNTHWSY